MSKTIRVHSWNVNGLRACAKKGFLDWLQADGGDIVGLQEIRTLHSQLPAEVAAPEGWHVHLQPAERKGYSGVGLYARLPIDEVQTSLVGTDGDPAVDVEAHDAEGRLQIATFGAMTIVNGYFPNGSGRNRDHSRVPFKLDFYRRLFDKLQPAFARGERILVMGDWNTAPAAVDLARPKANEKTSGFLPVERAEVARWLDHGWTDTFRHLHPEAEGAYTWWSQRFGVREKNVGWRIDLALASPGLMPFVRGAAVHQDVMGSDHCPISVDLDAAVLRP